MSALVRILEKKKREEKVPQNIQLTLSKDTFVDHIWIGPNLFFNFFYFLFRPGLFYPLRVLAKVQILNLSYHPKGNNKPAPKRK